MATVEHAAAAMDHQIVRGQVLGKVPSGHRVDPQLRSGFGPQQARNYEIRTPDVIIKVSPEKAQLIETRTIDGTPYILIEAADEVEINGILLKPSRPSDADDTEF